MADNEDLGFNYWDEAGSPTYDMQPDPAGGGGFVFAEGGSGGSSYDDWRNWMNSQSLDSAPYSPGPSPLSPSAGGVGGGGGVTGVATRVPGGVSSTGSDWFDRQMNRPYAPVRTPGAPVVSTPINNLRNATQAVRAPVARPTMLPTTQVMGMGNPFSSTSSGGTTDSLSLSDADQKLIDAETQRLAAPGIRQLRNAINQAQATPYENPNVKANTLRAALAGYGQGLEDVLGGATKTAMGMWSRLDQDRLQKELQSKDIASRESMQSAALASQQNLAQYEMMWKEYLASLYQ